VLCRVIAVAVAVRAAYAFAYLSSPLAGQSRADQGYYRDWAIQIAGGDLLGREVFEQGPLYAYGLALVYRVFGARDEPALALQLAAGVATSALVYACARRLVSARGTLFAGLACAAFGPLVFYECMVMKTFLSPLFTIAVVYLGLRYAEDARARWLAGAGAAVGLACLVRENHVLLAVPLAVQLAAVGRARGFGARRWLAHGLALGAAIAAMIAPAALRNYAVSGEWVAVTAGGGEVFYIAHGPHANGYFAPPPFVGTAGPAQQHAAFRAEASRRLGREVSRAESSRYWAREAAREAIAHPARSAHLALVKLSGLLNDFEAPSDQFYAVTRVELPWLRALPTFGWVAGLGLLGIASVLRAPARFALPLLALAAHALSFVLTFDFGSFRAGMIPVWLLFAGHGADRIAELFAARRRAASAAAALFAAAVSALAFRPPLDFDRMPFAYERAVLEMELSIARGDDAATEQHLRDALEHAPAHRKAEAHRALGQLLEETGRADEAERHLRAADELESGARPPDPSP